MEEPILTRFDPNDLPIISLALVSDRLSAAELTRLADPGITRELRGLQGVAEVEVVGGLERELTVALRPQALQAAGIGVGQVVQSVQSQNLAAPVGRLQGELAERTIRLRGRLQSPEDFAQIAVAQSGGRLIRLGEIAEVRDATEEQRTLALFDGEEAVGINITKATNASTTAVAERVLEQVESIRETLPEGVGLRVVQNSGERVENSVANVQEALLEGALLTILTVFLFLNSWRSTVITGLALPVSVLASFVAVWAFGFTLNTMSLLGLSLAIGILIDDAIVVRENIVRHVEMGKSHYRAAQEGTAEIGLAVAATTFSIVVVFVPIAFMGGIAGQWFKPFALTLACSVLVSLFVSFSLDPMLSAYWPDPHKEEHEKAWITRQLDKFNRWFDRQAENYKRVIGWALDHRLAMVGLAGAAFFGALALPALGVIGGAFFPEQDVSEFNVVIDTPPGSNLPYTRLKAEEVARLARAKPEVAYTYTTIGGQSGAVDEANVYVRLTPKAERDRHQTEIQRELRPRAGDHRRRDGRDLDRQLRRRKADHAPASGAGHRCAESAGGPGDGAGAGSAGRGGPWALDQGAEAGIGRRAGPRTGRQLRDHRGAGRAIAAAGVCRDRRGRLDRSAGGDAGRHRPARRGIPRESRRSRAAPAERDRTAGAGGAPARTGG